MSGPIGGARQLRDAAAERILNGHFDLRFRDGYVSKPGDGDYIPIAVEAHDDEVMIHCLATVTISIVNPRDVRVDHSGLPVIDAGSVSLTRHGDVIHSVGAEPPGESRIVIAREHEIGPRRDHSQRPLFQLVRVEF